MRTPSSVVIRPTLRLSYRVPGSIPDITSDTPSTPMTFRSVFMKALCSMIDRATLFSRFRSWVLTRCILIVCSSLGSRLTILACKRQVLANITQARMVWNPYISGKQRVDGKRPSFPLVVCSEDDEDVFDAHHQRECPNYKGECTEQVIIAGAGREGTGVDV